MRKILFWILTGFVLFAVLVVVIFVILSLTEKELDHENRVNYNDLNSLRNYSNLIRQERDSLSLAISGRDSLLQARNTVIDSLQNELSQKQQTIGEYKSSLETLEARQANNQNQQENIKNIAKSYEDLKVEEIRPILANVDNQTVIKIYQQMSSRKRQKIFQALEPERTAAITKILTQ